MSPALQSAMTSPEGIITLCAGLVAGVLIGVLLMAALDRLERAERTRLMKQRAAIPRRHSEIIAPETPLQRLVREAEHERKSA